MLNGSPAVGLPCAASGGACPRPPVDRPLIALATDEAARAMARDARLARDGWVRRFVAAPPRLDEAAKLYEQLGFELRLEQVEPSELPPVCGDCTMMLGLARAIYTRRRV